MASSSLLPLHELGSGEVIRVLLRAQPHSPHCSFTTGTYLFPLVAPPPSNFSLLLLPRMILTHTVSAKWRAPLRNCQCQCQSCACGQAAILGPLPARRSRTPQLLTPELHYPSFTTSPPFHPPFHGSVGGG